MVYLHSLQSEWLKTKRSTSFWICVVGGCFIPLIQMGAFLHTEYSINSFPTMPGIWQMHYNQMWSSMLSFLLPMTIILFASLITQLEYKNNTWKQLHTTPQSFTMVFIAKLSAILLMILQFFIFFNIAVIAVGYLSTLLIDGAMPKESLPVLAILKSNTKIFITILPLVAAQYLISLRFKNFLVPVGIGLLMLVAALILANLWKYAYLLPAAFCVMNVIPMAQANVPGNYYATAGIYFVIITALNYLLYINRSEKG